MDIRRGPELVLVTIISVVALVVVLGALAAFGGWRPTDRAAIQGLIPYPEGLSGKAYHSASATEDTVYFTAHHENGDLWITAVDAATWEVKWRLDEPLHSPDELGMNVYPGRDAVMVTSPTNGSAVLYMVDAATGAVAQRASEMSVDSYGMVGGVPVNVRTDELVVLGPDGDPLWSVPVELLDDSRVAPVYAGSPMPAGDVEPVSADRLLVYGGGTASIHSAQTGEVASSGNAVPAGWTPEDVRNVVVVGRILYVSGGQRVAAFDIENGFTEIGDWTVSEAESDIYTMEPCGTDRVCVEVTPQDLSGRDSLWVIGGADPAVLWSSPPDAPDFSWTEVGFAGGNTVVAYTWNTDPDHYASETRVYGPDGTALTTDLPGVYQVVDDTTIAGMAFTESGEYATVNGEQIETYDATLSLMDSAGTPGTEWSASGLIGGCLLTPGYLACADTAGYRLWHYRP